MRRRARAGLNTGHPHFGFGTILEQLHRERQPRTLHVLLLGHRVQRYAGIIPGQEVRKILLGAEMSGVTIKYKTRDLPVVAQKRFYRETKLRV